jgi:hypothetical protein
MSIRVRCQGRGSSEGDFNGAEIRPQGHQAANKTLICKEAGDLFAATNTPGGYRPLFVNDGTALDLVSEGYNYSDECN